MKNFLLSLFGLACLGTASAETYMHVDYNGKTDSYNADEVIEVTFKESGADLGGHDYVDLGLPSGTKWATCNVGAEKPEDYGDFFTWGEVEKFTESDKDRINYPAYGKSQEELYGAGIISLDGSLAATHDAATFNWGNGWRTPTMEEFEELAAECVFEPYMLNDVRGMKVSSKVNDQWLFIPNSGWYDNRVWTKHGELSYLWSATGNFDNKTTSYSFLSSPFSSNVSGNPRTQWMAVRPVLQNAEEPKTYMIVHFKREGSDYEDTKEYLLDDIKDVRFVQFNDDNYSISGEVGGYEFVDLKLPSGIRWATCNVGWNCDGLGDPVYYAWGETKPQEPSEGVSIYTYSSYKWNGGDGKYSKYVSNSKYGTVDNLLTLLPEDDAAAINMGNGWRMPTAEEQQELLDFCDWYWRDNYMNSGMSGYLGISKENGEKIFLPADGCMDADEKRSEQSGYYWNSSANEQLATTGGFMGFGKGYIYVGDNGRTIGMFIRAVVEEETPVTQFVDLGLSVDWASYNIGATKPEEYGDFFAWGEVETKTDYSSANSLTYSMKESELLEKGIIDKNGNLTPTYDPATVNWGDECRLPTRNEIEELVSSCNWTHTTMEGVRGYKVSSKQPGNNNWIFLPAAGLRIGETGKANNDGYQGNYWSSTVGSRGELAYRIVFTPDEVETGLNNTDSGRPVRAVREKKK